MKAIVIGNTGNPDEWVYDDSFQQKNQLCIDMARILLRIDKNTQKVLGWLLKPPRKRPSITSWKLGHHNSMNPLPANSPAPKQS